MTDACLTVVILALVALCAYQQRTAARERSKLLQRIQAPERAVVEESAASRPLPSPPPIALGDDETAIAEAERREYARGED